MKGIIRLILMIGTLACQSSVTIAQNSDAGRKGPNGEDMDSLIKAMIKEDKDAIREHDLHKDNKDSAWIRDYNTDSINKVVWDSRSKSKEGKTITILDSINNNYYVLDTSHTVITAYNESNKIIWAVNPRKDYYIPEYRHKNPKVTYFRFYEFSNDDYRKNYMPHKMDEIGNRVITIRYNNSQFGIIDLKTGKFVWLGQD